MRVSGLVAVLAMVELGAGCGDDLTPCVTRLEADGSLTLQAGPLCVRGVTATARVDGRFTTDGVAAELEPIPDGVVVTLTGPAGAEAFALAVPEVEGDRMLQQGYQSWSFSAVTTIPTAVTLADDGAPELAVAATGDVTGEELGVSYGSAVIGGGSGPYLVLGATSSADVTTGIAATRTSDGHAAVTVVYGAAREELPVVDGQSRSRPIAFIGADRAQDGLAGLRDQIAARLPADRAPARRPQGGWFSWNERFDAIDQAYIRAHIAIAADELLPRGLPVVEIDDGWEKAWGDWTENDRFADGMAALGSEITAAGLVPGVWMAPFLVDVDSEVAASLDPALLVEDASGAPLVHRYAGSNRGYYVLDGGDPDAMALATDAVVRLREAGFRFFKLDYLYAGALPGRRASGMTGNQALIAGLGALRDAAGPDAVVNACGSPIYPVIGHADSLRIGPDSAFVIGELALPHIASPARSYAARSHLFPLIWPDNDSAQLRPPYDAALAELSTVTVALAGPAYSLGDDLTVLSADRLALALAPAVMELVAAEAPAQPIDLMDSPTDELLLSPLLEAITSPTDTRAPPPTTFAVTGASGTPFEVVFDWSAHRVEINE